MRPILLLIAGFILSIGPCHSQETQKRSIEPNHSTIGFSIPISNGLTRVTGKFMKFDLTMELVNDDHTVSSLKFVIDASSIDTGIPDRDQHLRSADFFDVEQYPEIVFESSEIHQVEGENYLLKGNLTMHGNTYQEEIPFSITGTSGSYIGYQIRWVVDRMKYGVGADWQHTADPDFLGEKVDVVIDLWTRKAKEQ